MRRIEPDRRQHQRNLAGKGGLDPAALGRCQLAPCDQIDPGITQVGGICCSSRRYCRATSRRTRSATSSSVLPQAACLGRALRGERLQAFLCSAMRTSKNSSRLLLTIVRYRRRSGEGTRRSHCASTRSLKASIDSSRLISGVMRGARCRDGPHANHGCWYQAVNESPSVDAIRDSLMTCLVTARIAAPTVLLLAFADAVTSRHPKQRGIGVAALDIRHAIDRFTIARIAAPREHGHLQLR